MRTGNLRTVPVLSALALVTMVVPYAHAGCGLYRPASLDASSQRQFGLPRFVRAAFVIDDDEAKIRTQHGRNLEREMDIRRQ